MTKIRWFGTGCSARGAPVTHAVFGWRPCLMALIAATALLEMGCQSGLSGNCGPNPCGPTGCGFFSRMRERMFRPRAAECCPIGAEAPLEMGAPAVVTPGVGPAVVPALPAAPSEAAPTELAPIEKSTIEKVPSAVPAPTDSGAQAPKPSNGRANYEATGGSRNRLGQTRVDDVQQAVVTTSEPASVSARGSTPSSLVPAVTLLEHLPPVEEPREWGRNEIPPAAENLEPTAIRSANSTLR